jgi:hypothetical protein
MAQKAIEIYTPAATAAHINAEDDAQLNRALVGDTSCIGNIDGKLACTKVDNNTVRLSSGVFFNQGYRVVVPGGQTADLTVTSGTSGQYRRDYVVAEFVRGGGAVADAHVFKVIAGTPAASAAAAAYPTLTQNNLAAGGTTRQEALYGLLIEGTTLNATITRIAPLSGTYA